MGRKPGRSCLPPASSVGHRSLGFANSIKMSLHSLLHNEPLSLIQTRQAWTDMTETGRWVFFFFLACGCISFLTFESDGSNPYLQALTCRTSHARESISSPCYSQASAGLPNSPPFPPRWLLSSTFFAHEANLVFGYSMQGPLKSRRAARWKNLGSTQLQLEHPKGLCFSSQGVCLSEVFIVAHSSVGVF